LWPGGVGTAQPEGENVMHSQVETGAGRDNRVDLDGIELEYTLGGVAGGEPVQLMHAGVLADWFVPLLTEPALAERYQLILYHRIGYAGSSRPSGPVSIADQALHARSLLRHLGIDRAHIVGHSSSANIALQLALDAPEAVVTLTLLEPAARTARAARPREPRDWVQRSSGITLVTARAPSTHSCGL
jgi:pimeloyl-ACP methyl ester carboxylesterase